MKNGNGKPQVGRSLPHSLEAEEMLLSCCFLDGNDVIVRCLAAHIGPKSFYDPKHGIIYERIIDLFHRQQPTEIHIVAEELKSHSQLDQVGGYPFLVQVSSRVPTTAQASYYIDEVFAQAALREMIVEMTRGVEKCYTHTPGDLPEIIESVRTRLDRIQYGTEKSVLRRFSDFPLPKLNDDNSLLGKNRYIGRGDGVLIVGSSGMGKSVFNYEWAALAAVGRPFLGIATRKPLKSLIVQAEDSDGDVGEVLFSLKHVHKFTEKERALLDENIIFIREKVARGEAFIAKLRGWVEKVKPDLVWINPLHAYAGCDITDATEMGKFLRGGLNALNKDDQFAYMIVHHTPKPLPKKQQPDKQWHEQMYDAAGSAELVNWARAVITVKPTEEEGKFNIVLAKRGRRAGVMIEKESEAGIVHLETTLKIPAQHSAKTVRIEGRDHPFQLLCWESRAPDATEEKKTTAGREEKYQPAELVTYYPSSSEDGQAYCAVQRLALEGCGMTKSTFQRRYKELLADGLIEQLDDKTWRRTPRGDALVPRKTI